VGAALKRDVGHPSVSNLAACLWAISEYIADHISELCVQRGGSYDEAAKLAFTSAVEYCQPNGQ
jgi:hypothetical protein